MTKDQAEGILRAAIAGIGGYFAGKGYVTNEQLMAIGGMIGPLVAAWWSFKSKKVVK